MRGNRKFSERLRICIGAVQGVHPSKINISEAARVMGVPETTLHATLKGCFPRTAAYWSVIRKYCQVSLDWLICGIGEGPIETGNRSALQEHEKEKLRRPLFCLECGAGMKGTLLDFMHRPPGQDCDISCSKCGWALPDILAREIAFKRLAGLL